MPKRKKSNIGRKTHVAQRRAKYMNAAHGANISRCEEIEASGQLVGDIGLPDRRRDEYRLPRLPIGAAGDGPSTSRDILPDVLTETDEDMFPNSPPQMAHRTPAARHEARKYNERRMESERRKKTAPHQASQQPTRRDEVCGSQQANDHSVEEPEVVEENPRQRRRPPPRSRYRLRKANETLAGTQVVRLHQFEPLFDSQNGQPLGTICEHCDAVTWPGERPDLCCASGKVQLDPIFDCNDPNLERFRELWTANHPDALLFREYARNLNNALSLASLKVTHVRPPDGGWMPTMVIQGKVAIQMGPLRRTDPDHRPPAFAQLYVLDPVEADQQLHFRKGTLIVGAAGLSKQKERRLETLLEELQLRLAELNPYVKDFQHGCELLQRPDVQNVTLKIDAERRPPGEHARRFNAEFAEVSVVLEDERPGRLDIVLVERGPGNHVQCLPDQNRAVDALRFTLLFPKGEDGWHLGLRRRDFDRNRQPKRVTGRNFYAYHLLQRHPIDQNFNPILCGGKLLQEYACLAAAKIENQELLYIKRNQKQLRSESYRQLRDQIREHDARVEEESRNAAPSGALETEEVNISVDERHVEPDLEPRLGRLVILPPSHIGSPRHMHQHNLVNKLDAMAIVREFHKPDLFITFTCNPQWNEITASLLPNQKSADRPELVARVFQLKLKEFLKDATEGFGKTAAHVHVIEFQKRGLPHCHLLTILSGDCRIRTADEVDQLICAELPADPEQMEDGPEKEHTRRMLDLVVNHMVHVCSQRCRPEGHNMLKCSKGFPHDFCEETIWDENRMYPEYRRRQGREVVVKNKVVDNRFVVPYNPHLLLKYEAHINVEVCVSPTSVKYLYKYIHKGGDRHMINASTNEVDEYQNLRSIGATEACWGMFEFRMMGRHPAVQRLRIHLDEQQPVLFREGQAREAVDEGARETELTAFFKFNQQNPQTQVTYVDFPKDHVWNEKQRVWTPRKRQRTIGRVHVIHPTCGDLFYLRLLLHHEHCQGKTSFDDLLAVDGQVHDSYKAVCETLGILRNDGEWDSALEEAALTKMPSQIRNLFLVILLFCEPSSPQALFEKHHSKWSDDFKRTFPLASDEDLKLMLLLELERKLQEQGRELATYNLPVPTADERARIANIRREAVATKDSVVMQEELGFDLDETLAQLENHVALLNQKQREFYNEIVHHLQTEEAAAFFLDARGGTGKTFLLNTILAKARTLGNTKNVAIGVASSGIAAILLALGRTFHSRFKAPIHFVDDNVTFGIKPNDSIAKVLNAAKIIVWDEAPMLHHHLLDGLDRLLCDLKGSNEYLFGGKLVVLSGDFRQVLPVIKHGTRAQVAGAAHNHSSLWQYFSIRYLTENMRLDNNPELADFDRYLERMGDGRLEVIEEPDWVQLPQDRVFHINEDNVEKSMLEFVDLIFPDIHRRVGTTDWIHWVSERAVLTPRNVDVDWINEKLVKDFPGNLAIITSADSTENPDDSLQFPLELLNTLTPAGIPPHQLHLKKGIVVLLLRNLNPRAGLCNGTRMIVDQIVSNHLLICTLVSGSKVGEKVLIPRIELTVEEQEFPIKWRRRQFPLRPAFATTINKSQGQTLQKVGVWLHEPCFSHGQLYVASSRVGAPNRLHYAISDNATRNVVYSEALI